MLNDIDYITAVPLTVRDMNSKLLPETVCLMDAASERTWTYLQRVSGDSLLFMFRIVYRLFQAELWFVDQSKKLTGQQ